MQAFFGAKHVMFLCGEQGAGKSTLAARLIYDHQIRLEPFQIQQLNAPNQLASAQATEPTLVYIPDPFGRYEPRADADEWAVTLSSLCRHARGDFKVLVTTPEVFAGRYLDDPRLGLGAFRFDVLGTTFDGASLLEAHLADRGGAVEPEARRWVSQHSASIIVGLDRPFSYDALMNLVTSVPAADRTDARMTDLVRDAASASHGIELERLFERESAAILAGLVVVWLVLEAWPHEDLEGRLEGLEDLLITAGQEVEVTGAATKLRVYRMLRHQHRSEVMHPIYLEKCSVLISQKWRSLAKRISGVILDSYIATNRLLDAEALLRLMKNKALLQPATAGRASAVARTDVQRLAACNDLSGGAFESALRLLASAGDPEDCIVLLAMSVCQRPTTPEFWDGTWSRPTWAVRPSKKFEEVVAHPDTPPILRAFVRLGFPGLYRGWLSGAPALVAFLYELVDLSPEFDKLAARIDDFHDPFLVEIIIRGAARSRAAEPEKLMQRAVLLWERYERYVADFKRYDEDLEMAADHYADVAWAMKNDVLIHVDAILELQERRGDTGWAATRSEPFVFQCYGKRVTDSTDEATFQRVWTVCPVEARGDMLSNIESPGSRVRFTLQFLEGVPAPRWSAVLARLPNSYRTSPGERVEVADRRTVKLIEEGVAKLAPFERVGLIHEFLALESSPLIAAIRRMSLSPGEADAVAALETTRSLSPESLDVLKALATSAMPAAGTALLALARADMDVDRLIIAGLDPRGDEATARAALEAISMAPLERRVELARHALVHRIAEVRKYALRILKDCPGDDAISAIVSLEGDLTGSVRIAVVDALTGRTEAPAWRALLRLCKNIKELSKASRSGRPWLPHQESELRVAHAAVTALSIIQPKTEEFVAAVRAQLG